MKFTIFVFEETKINVKTKFQYSSNTKKTPFKLLLESIYANLSELLFSVSNYCKRKAVVNVILLSFKVHLSVDQKTS